MKPDNSIAGGLATLINAHFETLNDRMDRMELKQDNMLQKQDITNGRVNRLENWQSVHRGCELKTAESFAEIKDKIAGFEKKNGKIILWFTEKPMRIVLVIIPLYGVIYLLPPEKMYNLIMALFS